jgi:hypothetical protein
MAGSRTQPPIGGNSFSGQPKLSREEAAEYISSLLDEMRLVAGQSDLPFLAYLLSVALEEANAEKAKHSQPEPTAR